MTDKAGRNCCGVRKRNM